MRLIGAIVLVILIALGAIQFVPYGRSHTNPPVRAEPAWDTPRTRALAVRACFDCHSNETRWPWYSNLAPLSWQVQNHVEEGRDALNFSIWDRQQEGDDAAETVAEGSMPPRYYTFTHSGVRLSLVEKEQLIEGLIQTFGGGIEGSREDRDEATGR
jgi:hypothetical protein